jgi:hypothetical protein
MPTDEGLDVLNIPYIGKRPLSEVFEELFGAKNKEQKPPQSTADLCSKSLRVP